MNGLLWEQGDLYLLITEAGSRPAECLVLATWQSLAARFTHVIDNT